MSAVLIQHAFVLPRCHCSTKSHAGWRTQRTSMLVGVRKPANSHASKRMLALCARLELLELLELLTRGNSEALLHRRLELAHGGDIQVPANRVAGFPKDDRELGAFFLIRGRSHGTSGCGLLRQREVRPALGSGSGRSHAYGNRDVVRGVCHGDPVRGSECQHNWCKKLGVSGTRAGHVGIERWLDRSDDVWSLFLTKPRDKLSARRRFGQAATAQPNNTTGTLLHTQHVMIRSKDANLPQDADALGHWEPFTILYEAVEGLISTANAAAWVMIV
eukprot:366000-Chlamydomonas_euryale.AAC.34